MCNTAVQYHDINNIVEPFTFSTFHLLRTCNRFIPISDNQTKQPSNSNKDTNNDRASPLNITKPFLDNIYTHTEKYSKDHNSNNVELNDSKYNYKDIHSSPVLEIKSNTKQNNHQLLNSTSMYPTDSRLPLNLPNPMASSISSGSLLAHKSPFPGFEYITQANHAAAAAADYSLLELNRVGMFPAFVHRRTRGEKRPIPDEQKDEKYYERRKRNNEAAKKSRDARKIREDRIAFRAALLEQENSILRTQVLALRDELQTMRQLLNGRSMAIGNKTASQL